MKNFVVYSVLLSSLSALGGSQASADVAAVNFATREVVVFYKDGDKIVARTCMPGPVVKSKEDCQILSESKKTVAEFKKYILENLKKDNPGAKLDDETKALIAGYKSQTAAAAKADPMISVRKKREKLAADLASQKEFRLNYDKDSKPTADELSLEKKIAELDAKLKAHPSAGTDAIAKVDARVEAILKQISEPSSAGKKVCRPHPDYEDEQICTQSKGVALTVLLGSKDGTKLEYNLLTSYMTETCSAVNQSGYWKGANPAAKVCLTQKGFPVEVSAKPRVGGYKIKDLNTGLVWAQELEPKTDRSYSESKTRCLDQGLKLPYSDELEDAQEHGIPELVPGLVLASKNIPLTAKVKVAVQLDAAGEGLQSRYEATDTVIAAQGGRKLHSHHVAVCVSRPEAAVGPSAEAPSTGSAKSANN